MSAHETPSELVAKRGDRRFVEPGLESTLDSRVWSPDWR